MYINIAIIQCQARYSLRQRVESKEKPAHQQSYEQTNDAFVIFLGHLRAGTRQIDPAFARPVFVDPAFVRPCICILLCVVNLLLNVLVLLAQFVLSIYRSHNEFNAASLRSHFVFFPAFYFFCPLFPHALGNRKK